jgi:hypothetical protein
MKRVSSDSSEYDKDSTFESIKPRLEYDFFQVFEAKVNALVPSHLIAKVFGALY